MAVLSTGYIFLETYTTYSTDTVNWGSAVNASSDGPLALAGPSTLDGNTNYLVAKQVGSDLKVGAHIKGIQLEMDVRSTSDDTRYVRDLNIQLFKNGVPVGTNKAASNHWAIILTKYIFGGAADLWGVTGNWNDNEVKDSGFGIGIRQNRFTSGGSNVTGYCNTLKIQVHYNPTGMFMAM